MLRNTHVLTLLDPCPQTGRPCEVARALLDTLASAMSAAGNVVGPDLNLTGTVETRACGHLCRLQWSGTENSVEVGAPSLASGPALRAERLPGRLA